MKIPFVEYGKSYLRIKDKVLPEIDRILSAGDLILRNDVEKFEENLAKYVGTKFAVALNSGTDALFLSLKALGIKAGDEVITSGYTFWATAEAIINCGALPVLADIGDDLLIDCDDVEKKITEKTKAIIPVHIGGAVCNMDKIIELAKVHNLFIVEDTAQCLGGFAESGLKAGAIGNVGCFSFYPAKVLGCYGDAGAITTDDGKLADKIKLLRNHGGKPHPQLTGFNSRMDNLQAVVLNIRLQELEDLIKRRNEIAEIYNQELSGLQDGRVYLPKSQTYQEYNLVVRDKRNRLYDFLKENEIETIKGDYTFPIAQPNKTIIANDSVLRLPIWPTLEDEQIKYVCQKINEFYKV